MLGIILFTFINWRKGFSSTNAYELLSVKVICDRRMGKSKGYGFVQFTSDIEAADALQKMDGQVCSRLLPACSYGCLFIYPIKLV